MDGEYLFYEIQLKTFKFFLLMKKYFTKEDFIDMMLILSVLRVKSDCFDAEGRVKRARYVVCIDDDITSAFYAMYIYHLIYATYSYHPFILCVGGRGMLSKFTNEKGESEGMKLKRVSLELGADSTLITVLDNGTNTGLNCLDIYNHVAKNPGKIIFAVTMRLGKRLKLTWDFLPNQYKDKVNKNTFELIQINGVNFYSPDETAEDMMQVYNCKGLAKGVMLLAEVASVYNRCKFKENITQAELDIEVPDEVTKAYERLAVKYPLKINLKCFNSIWQYPYAFCCVMFYKPWVKSDMRRAVKHIKKQFNAEFGLHL